MVRLAGDAARFHEFNPNSLQVSLAKIARRSFGDGSTVNQVLEEGWKQGVAHAMADGIISPDEEDRLKELENQMALMTVPRIQAPQYGPHKPQRGFDYPKLKAALTAISLINTFDEPRKRGYTTRDRTPHASRKIGAPWGGIFCPDEPR